MAAPILAPAAKLAPMRWAVAGGATALLALFWWLAVSAAAGNSPTSDELPHIASGFAYDRFGDFRMQPENGNLPQRLFGLPALAAGAHLPIDPALWRRSTYWQIAWDFFYADGNPIDAIVLRARALNALLGVALGALIFFVARRAFRSAGGLLALAFYALAPNFLAHAALATSDMAAALFLTLAPWLFWRHLEKRDLVSGLLAGLVSGLTLVAKFNGVLLAPIYALLVVADPWLRESAAPRARLRRTGLNLALAAAQAVAAIVVVWAFFNFRFSARGPGMPELESFAFDWPGMFQLIGTGQQQFIKTALLWKMLPEAWLYGLTNVLAGAAGRPAFFAGEHGIYGWWQFFPTLFLVKTPLATLTALLLAAGVGTLAWLRADASARRRMLTLLCPLAVTALIVWFTALRSHLNVGDRHILAVYPIVFVALGALATRRVTALIGVALVLGAAAESFAIRPHYLASFNALAGGPANAHRLVVDSSLDWGQDLPTLRDWLAGHRRPGEKLYLGYFGSAWPPHYGVRPDFFLPTGTYIVRPPLVRYECEPGLYCVSATLLSEVYSPYRGPWTPAYERLYRDARRRLATAAPDAPLPSDYADFDQLRFARLCKFLQTRTPDADAGHSILIYRLSSDELHAAFDLPAVGTHRLQLP